MQCLGSVSKGRCTWIQWKALNTSSRKTAQKNLAKHLKTDLRINRFISFIGTQMRKEKNYLVLSSGCQGIHGRNHVSTSLQKFKTDIGDDISTTPAYHSLLNETTVPLFLTKLDHLCENRIISAEHFSLISYQLQAIFYDQLYKEFPWLYKNTSFAFKQLARNRKSDDCFTPVLQNPCTQNFRCYVEDEINNIPPLDCSHILLSFIYIGEPLDSTFVQKMFDRILELNTIIDVNGISSIVKVLSMFPRPNKKLLELIFSQLDVIFQKGSIDNICDMSLKSVCNILMNLFPYYSDDFCALGTAYALKIARAKKKLSYSDVSTGLRMLFRILMPQNLQNVESNMSSLPEYMKNLRDLEKKIYENLPQYIDQFTGKDFAAFSKTYSFFDKIDEDVFERLTEKRTQIFNQSDICVTEVADVIRLISKPCGEETYHRLNTIVMERLQEVDVITLSRFCSKILEFKLYNMEVKAKFEEKVTEMLDLLSDYGSVEHLHKVLFVATRWKKSQDAVFVNRFSSRLVELLNGQHGLNPFTVCLIFSYLLCSLQEEFPYHMLEKLLGAIPRVQTHTLSSLLAIINQNKTAANISHAMEIKSALLSALKERATNTPTTSILLQLKLALKSSPTDNLLVEALSNLPEITKNMSQNDFVQLCDTFKLLNYHYQEVYEDMENYFLDNFRSLDKGNISDLVQGYSKNGYKPLNLEDFSEKCCQTAGQFLRSGNVYETVMFLFNLCRMQIFADECLSHIFTLEYMKLIDETDMSRGSRAYNNYQMKVQLGHLNRCVVIECPQLNIPLFYKDVYSSVINQDNGQQSNFYRNVRLVLNQVLGGNQYYGTFVKSPYGHDIFFECILDNYENLVAYQNEDNLFPNSDFKRVAILLWSKRNYCLHSHHLGGNSIMLRRHLEIMGYKVVEVPYYEWFSMALTDTFSKENYLHNKIFN